MHPALWISRTGIDAQQTQISVISNNLANANTVGYKKGRAIFEDLLYQNIRQPGASTSQDSELASGLMMGTGVRTAAVQKNFEQGPTISTNNTTDMAINGRGFFQVLTPNGELAYTRDGRFQINPEGQLATSSGYVLQPSITIPEQANSFTVGVDGIVSVTSAGSSTPSQIGTIELADFINPAGLEPKGENLYIETAASGAATTGTPSSTGLGSIRQKALEGSNVNIVEEMVGLIETQRAYEINSKAIATVDAMLQFVSQSL